MSGPAISTVTPDFIAKVKRLEAIFMPFGRNQRDQKMSRDNPPNTAAADMRMRYAHYTSAEAALRIIHSKRLWMRNAKAMADFKEVELGYETLLRYFGAGDNRQRFLTAANSCVPGSGETILGSFDNWWNHIRLNTYIASMSDHDAIEDKLGRLSMWRAFGSGKPRVALVIGIPLFSGAAMALGVNFSPVAYHAEADAHGYLEQAIANTVGERAYLQGTLTNEEFAAWWFQTLVSAVTCVKHAGFYEEREWRAVYTTALSTSRLLEYSTEVVRDVPQKIYKVPLDATASPELASLEHFPIIEDRIRS